MKNSCLQTKNAPIFKKGDAKERSNDRTIAVISHVSKVTLKVLWQRLLPPMEQKKCLMFKLDSEKE